MHIITGLGRVAPEQIQKAIEAATQVEDEQKLYALNWSAPAELGSPKPRNPRHFDGSKGGRNSVSECFRHVLDKNSVWRT